MKRVREFVSMVRQDNGKYQLKIKNEEGVNVQEELSVEPGKGLETLQKRLGEVLPTTMKAAS